MITGIFKRNPDNSFMNFSQNLKRESIINNQFYLKIENVEDINMILEGCKQGEGNECTVEGEERECHKFKTLLIKFDRHSNTLTLKNDHFGNIPIYYYSNKEWFIFSSSLFGVLEYLNTIEINPKALSDVSA